MVSTCLGSGFPRPTSLLHVVLPLNPPPKKLKGPFKRDPSGCTMQCPSCRCNVFPLPVFGPICASSLPRVRVSYPSKCKMGSSCTLSPASPHLTRGRGHSTRRCRPSTGCPFSLSQRCSRLQMLPRYRHTRVKSNRGQK